MDGNHPKRRKDKYNPYTIGTTEDGRHWLTFTDGQGHRHHFEISAAVFALFDAFELDDLSYLNEVDRHYEQSELTEGSLYDRAVHRPATVEESAIQSMEYAQLHVSGYLDFAERQAEREQAMTMQDWAEHLDRILTMSGEQLLIGNGSVSHKQAIDKATGEYRKYKARTLSEVEQDYLDSIKLLEQKTDKKQD